MIRSNHIVLSRFSLRELRSRPVRALLTLLSVVLGVASVVAVTLATGTTRKAFKDLFASVAGKADLVVSSEGGDGFSQAVLADLDKLPGLAAVVPNVQRPSVLYSTTASGKDIHVALLAMGVDAERERGVREFEIVSGRYFEQEGEAVLDAGFAEGLGIATDDVIRLRTTKGREEFKIVGLIKLQGGAGVTQAGMAFIPLKQAQRLFRAKDKLDGIDLVFKPNVDKHAVQKSAADVLPVGLTIGPPSGGSQLAEETMLGSETGLLVATVMALVVAAFIILNTFFINVSERRRQLAILRAIGATRGQIVRMLLMEGFFIGVGGTVAGMGAGILGAVFLTRSMGELFQVSLPAMQLSWPPFAFAAVFGIGISLISTFLPARSAGKVSPLEGMGGLVRSDEAGEKGNMLALALGLFVIGFSLTALVLTGYMPAGITRIMRMGLWFGGSYTSLIDPEVILALVGTVLQLIGGVFLLSVILRPIVNVASAVLSPLLGVEGRLARQQLLRRRTRTSLTIGVLFVAVSTGIAMGSTLFDNVADVRNWYNKAIVGDFFVRAMMPDTATGKTVDMPDGLRDELARIPRVNHLASVRFVRTRAGQKLTDPAEIENRQALEEEVVLVIREFDFTERAHLDLIDTDAKVARDKLLAGEVVIGAVLAERMKIQTGEEIVIESPDGELPLRIAGTANDYIVSGRVIYMDRAVAERLLKVEGSNGYILHADKSEHARIEATLKEICDRDGLMLQSRAEMTGTIDGMMTGIVACQWVILGLGFFVAAFGIVNTLTMNVLEQTRELGLLRTVAMTRRQVRKLILAQAAMIGLISLTPGILVGLGEAVLINLQTQAVTGHPIAFNFRPGLMAGTFCLGFVIVLIAAAFPAERAARLDLTTALKYE